MAKKALLVGAGAMGRAWAQNLKDCDDVELVAWVDILPGQAKRAAEDKGVQPKYLGVSLEDAIAATHPDFVVDVTIPEAHHDVTLFSLNHGLPVIGEKPMATSMKEAQAMVAASEESGNLYMVSQSRRYDGRIHAYKRLIKKDLGHLGILNADFYIGAHFGGFRDEMPSPLLLDMAIHTFDQARYLSGTDPVSVYCEEFNPSWSWYVGNACANVLFEMTNGVHFSFRGSWCSEGMHTSWDADWRAIGEKGTICWDGHANPTGEVVKSTDGFLSEFDQVTSPAEKIYSGIAGSLRDFLQTLETGKAPQGECHDNIKSLAMVFAAVESAKQGRRIKVEW
ncbi:MAG: Gfo/Idh/MocA family oxidoreductase [Chthonomonadales bacterium]